MFPATSCSGRRLQACTDTALTASVSRRAKLVELPGRMGWLPTPTARQKGLRSQSSCLDLAAGLENSKKNAGGRERFLQPWQRAGERHRRCLLRRHRLAWPFSASQSPAPWGTLGRKTSQRHDRTKGMRRAEIRDPTLVGRTSATAMKRKHPRPGRGMGTRCKRQQFKLAAQENTSPRSGMLPARPCLHRVPHLLSVGRREKQQGWRSRVFPKAMSNFEPSKRAPAHSQAPRAAGSIARQRHPALEAEGLAEPRPVGISILSALTCLLSP